MFGTRRQFVLINVIVVACATAAFGQEAEDSYRDQALALNRVTGDNAITAKIRELRKDRAALGKLLSEATALTKEKEQNPPLNYTANYILAKTAQSVRDYESSEFFYRRCIENAFKLHSNQKKAQVFEGLIDLFERRKKYDEALLTCEKLLNLEAAKEDDNIERVKPFVAEKVVQLLCRKKDFNKALDTAEKLVQAYNGNWYFLHRKAEVYREMNKFDDAVQLLDEVIEKIAKEDNLKDEEKKKYTNHCKYVQSGIYIDLSKPDKSIGLLEELAASDPDNSTYQNDLGYILADNDRKFAEAEQHVLKALEIDRKERKKLLENGSIGADDDKDSSAYLDSLAWVYFKQKKYDQALEIMKKVILAEESQHVEIYDHVAEVYLALGQKADAVAAWEKALTLENASYRDDGRKAIVRKKLEAHK